MFLVDVLLGRRCPEAGDQVIDPDQYEHCESWCGTEIVISEDKACYPRYVIAFHKGQSLSKLA